MTSPYCCPNCKTNKTRFNLIAQVPQAVKMDPNTGEIVKEYEDGMLDPFHLPYRGPERKVQCAVCGLIDEEQAFIKRAEYMNKNKV